MVKGLSRREADFEGGEVDNSVIFQFPNVENHLLFSLWSVFSDAPLSRFSPCLANGTNSGFVRWG